MTTRQQQEALEYFRAHADVWRARAEDAGADRVNIIELRNAYVRAVAAERPGARTALDLGCGTGELVCDLARRGLEATGVDFAPEMIARATEKAQAEGLTRARFVCSSIFDFERRAEGSDLIAANGLIEYLSPAELPALLDGVAQALAPGGTFVVGARNRLFNLVSMNEFTLQELAAGSFEALVREAVAWTAAPVPGDFPSGTPAPPQAEATRHAPTGVRVATRYQHTPWQLMALVRARGLRVVEVYPVHVHGVTPAFKGSHGALHAALARLLQAHARHDPRLLVAASTFMLRVEREGQGP